MFSLLAIQYNAARLAFEALTDVKPEAAQV